MADYIASSKQEAREQRLDYYSTRPCKRCGSTMRFASSGVCVQCYNDGVVNKSGNILKPTGVKIHCVKPQRIRHSGVYIVSSFPQEKGALWRSWEPELCEYLGRIWKTPGYLLVSEKQPDDDSIEHMKYLGEHHDLNSALELVRDLGRSITPEEALESEPDLEKVIIASLFKNLVIRKSPIDSPEKSLWGSYTHEVRYYHREIGKKIYKDYLVQVDEWLDGREKPVKKKPKYIYRDGGWQLVAKQI